jgi:hypothetical protein
VTDSRSGPAVSPAEQPPSPDAATPEKPPSWLVVVLREPDSVIVVFALAWLTLAVGPLVALIQTRESALLSARFFGEAAWLLVFLVGWCAAGLAAAAARARVVTWLRSSPVWGWVLAGLIPFFLLWARERVGGRGMTLLFRGAAWTAAVLLLYSVTILYREHRAAVRALDDRFGPGNRSFTAFFAVPAITTVVFYLAALRYDAVFLAVRLVPPVFVVDLALQFLVGCALFAFARRVSLFAVAQLLLIGMLYVGNAVKINYVNEPLMPHDLYLLKELYWILPLQQFLLAAGPAALFVAIFLVNFHYFKKASSVSVVVIAALVATIRYDPGRLLRPLDRMFRPYFTELIVEQRERGVSVFLLDRIARVSAHRPQAPTREQVRENLERLGKTAGPPAAALRWPAAPRNVYVILVESMWDPEFLRNFRFSEPPFYPPLGDLWREGGQSTAFSPNFAGGTSDSEYELLCGMPDWFDMAPFIFFQENDMPCLPRIFGAAGYDAVAFHPHFPAFFNRQRTYPKIGFQRFYSMSSFKGDDVDGVRLADSSLYRQAAKLLERERRPPYFAFILTFASHDPYVLNRQRRPSFIRSEPDNELVRGYANRIRYTTKETYDFVEQTVAVDPDALIVVVGDHVPPLGYENYGRRDLFDVKEVRPTLKENTTPQMFEPPLIVLNGRAGPVRLGQVNMHELPSIILKLLGVEQNSWFDDFTPPGAYRVFTAFDAQMIWRPDGTVRQCTAADPDCGQFRRWKETVRPLVADILFGGQYAFGQ